MANRRYKAIYFVARVFEILGYVVMVAGIIASIVIAIESSELWQGIVGLVATLLFTLIFISASQIPLIFIDTENNTRQIAAELKKTNAMLSETLGRMAADLDKMAGSGRS